MAEKLTRNVKALGWVSFLNDVQSETILPLLPLFITQALGLNRAFLGLIEGVTESVSSLLKVASGWYSDRVRRRKRPTAAGYIVSAAAKPLFAFGVTGAHVLGIRLADRVGKGIREAPRDALIAESAPAGALGRAFGFHRMMDTFGAVVGAVIAYVALSYLGGSEEHRMRTAFLLSAVFGVAAVVVLLVFVRETASPEPMEKRETPATMSGADDPDTNRSRTDRSGTRRGRLAAFIGVNGLFHLGMFSYAFFLLRAQSLGVTTQTIPLIYLLYNVIYALTSFQMGKLADAIGPKPVILLAYTSYTVLCIGFGFASSAWHAWALFCLYGIHSATVNPASRALMASLSDARTHATALGAYHTSVGLTVLPASLGAGLLWDAYGAQTPFFLAGALALAATAAMLPLRLHKE